VDGSGESGALGQAGYSILGSGGGGASGRYVFASLQELDGIIADWEALRDRISARDVKFQRALSLLTPPAEDVMSRLQAQAMLGSLMKAQAHNRTMYNYADGYVAKLKSARSQYATTETDNVSRLRNSGKG
jgi:hypothetical protein